MTLKSITLGAALLLTAACGVRADGRPTIVVDRTPCSRCGMLISEPLYAGAYQAPGADARVFDDVGCLRDAARTEHGDLRVWVHDAASGDWIDGAAATFVSSATIRTPMGGGILAYRDASDADHAAVKHGARVLANLAALLHPTGGKS